MFQKPKMIKPLRLPSIAILLIMVVSSFSFTAAQTTDTALMHGNAAESYDLGLTLESQKKWRDACRCFKKSLELNPEFGSAWNELGRSYANCGDFQLAEQTLQQANTRFSGSRDTLRSTLRLLMWCETYAGMLEGLQRTRKEYVSQFPNEPDAKKIEDEIKYYEGDFTATRAMQQQQQAAWDSHYRCWFRPSDIPLMPIRVFVPEIAGRSVFGSQSGQLSYTELVKKALLEWSLATDGHLAFVFVDEPSKAQIAIEWTTDVAHRYHSFSQGETQTVELGKHGVTLNGEIYKAMIFLNPQVKMSPANFYRTCLHELGHALGLLQHSPSTADIMYFSALTPTTVSGDVLPHLGRGDIVRIRALYAGPAVAKATAIEFAQAAFVDKNYAKAHQLLSTTMQQKITPEKLQQMIEQDHSTSCPSTIEVSRCEPIPSHSGLNVAFHRPK